MEIAMRKISKARFARDDKDPQTDLRDDHRPRGVPGATITSWQGPCEIDLTALFARPTTGASVAGAAGGADAPRNAVALSDGTEISFASPADFTSVFSL
ncbi:MAG TPA: hypothetical protein DDZ81_12565 [Acetobacteraceae bacterium]|jgi:hypothetical protein|nr:hypothetical protein [Acetobacteraceae bacterium]